jgi:tetratricopeptide (TPR) repeat protein
MTNPLHSPNAFPGEKKEYKWITWAKAHQEIIAVGGIVTVLLCVGIPYYFHSLEQNEKDAMAALNLGQYYQHSPVDPVNGPFKSKIDKDQQSLQTFQRITTDYAGTHTAKIALYYAAKAQFSLGQYGLSYSSFDAASQELKDTPMGDEAYLGKILSLEAQNQWPQAITFYEAFLTQKADSFLIPEFHLRLANAYFKADNKSKGLEQLKWTAEKYADSAWGKEAARRLEALKS